MYSTDTVRGHKIAITCTFVSVVFTSLCVAHRPWPARFTILLRFLIGPKEIPMEFNSCLTKLKSDPTNYTPIRNKTIRFCSSSSSSSSYYVTCALSLELNSFMLNVLFYPYCQSGITLIKTDD